MLSRHLPHPLAIPEFIHRIPSIMSHCRLQHKLPRRLRPLHISWRRIPVYLATLAILFHSLLPLAEAGQTIRTNTAFGDGIVICTANGLKVVPVRGFTENDKPAPTNHATHCTFSTCSTCGYCSALSVSPVPSCLPAQRVRFLIAPPQDKICFYQAGTGNFQSRAPPIVI